jgi:hypothetical protein
MKKIILFASAIFLAGCMATESVQQREPVFVADTAKSAEVYSNCVHERWPDTAGSADRLTRPNGYRVRSIAGGIVDVTSTATGAHVEMREPPLSVGNSEKAAIACL